ncbi:MAG: oligosaccharide flippase family protein [Bacteroidaceae bacterium]|nr:oligosaccharide flippase family protein [Bacteroidaceae bacterium]
MPESSSKTIAKNALYLYIRTLITTLVGILTSRIVLQTLGVEDYGLYSVVGGVVGLFGFINGSMCSTTSRFITFDLGRGDIKKTNDTFCTAMLVHISIAVFVLILAETVGLWFLCNKVVVPEGRMHAAHWVYQLSILSALLGITQVPYDACMTAHERFDISAGISMFSTFAKLGVLYLVNLFTYDNLITYAILILLISYGTILFSRFYCVRHYSESSFHWMIDKEQIKPMLSFSGWQMVGCIGLVASQQGRSIVVNMFYGVVANAAVGIGQTVSGAINGLAYNLILAFQPSITKSYAAQRYEEFEQMVIKAGVLSFLMFSVFSIPLFVELDYVLDLWLGIVPQYAAEICGVHLILSNFAMIGIVLGDALHAIGRNRNQNAFSSIINILSVIIMYLFCRNSMGLIPSYMVATSLQIFDIFYKLHLYKCYTDKTVAWAFFVRVIFRMSLMYFFQLFVLLLLKNCLSGGFVGFVIVCVSSSLMSLVMLLFSGYRKTLKAFLLKN